MNYRVKTYGRLEQEVASLDAQVQFLQRELSAVLEHNARLTAQRDTLAGLLTEALPAIDPAIAGHSSWLGVRFDCNCVRCRIAEEAIRGEASGLNKAR